MSGQFKYLDFNLIFFFMHVHFHYLQPKRLAIVKSFKKTKTKTWVFQVNTLCLYILNSKQYLYHPVTSYNRHYWLVGWLTVSTLINCTFAKKCASYDWLILRKKPCSLAWIVFLQTMILCAVFILILVMKVTTHEQADLHRDSTHRHSSFAKRSNTILDVPIMTSAAFYDALYCAFQSLTHDQCISYVQLGSFPWCRRQVWMSASGHWQISLL